MGGKSNIAKALLGRGAGIIFVAFLISVTFLTIPRQPYAINDSFSEKVLLSYAHEHGLQFGTDIVFTYGPLGFLTSRYFFSHAASVRMVVDVLLGLIVGSGVFVLSLRLTSLWRYLLLVLFIVLSANIDPRNDLLLYIGLLCWGLLCLVDSGPRLAIAGMAFVLLGAFGILVKGNFLFFAGLSAAAIACDLMLRSKYTAALGLLTGLCAGVGLGWIAAGQNLSHLTTFLANSLIIIRGYDQAVGLDGLQTLRSRGLFTVVLATATVTLRALTAFDTPDSNRRWRRAVLLAWFSALLFIVWKHGFVRSDLYHMGFFFGFVPILVLILELLPGVDATARLWARIVGLACCLIAFMSLQSFFFLDIKSSLIEPFRSFRANMVTLLAPASYRKQMLDALEEARRGTDLPRIREIVGRSTVDVFGQDQCYAVFNGLNYRPRPVFQSYMAYNAQLMRLNEQFYLSDHSPDYVLFALTPVDHKYPPLEDAFVFRDLLINYAAVAWEGPFLLLKKKSSAQPRLTLLREGTVRLGQRIALDDLGNANIWMELQVQASVAGQVRKFFYKPSKVRLAVWPSASKSDIRKFPAPLPMLAAGFVASPLLLRNPDVQGLYSHGDTTTHPRAYSVEALPGEDYLWQEDVRYRIFKIENQLGR